MIWNGSNVVHLYMILSCDIAKRYDIALMPTQFV